MLQRVLQFVSLASLCLLMACSGSEDKGGASTSAAPASTQPGAIAVNNAPIQQPIPVPAAPQVPARAYFVSDFTTGQVLAASNENERMEPASLTKLMTAYGVFHALKNNRIRLADMVTVSAHARAQDGSRMFIEIGTQVSVENLVQGMIVQSGNDATVALAEHVAGSEPVFVDLMNQYAQQLGMSGTHFENSPGMPGPAHYTTARDIGLLAAALVREYPEYYKWYSQREFTWNKIKQPNRNGLLDRDPSVDGMKTGHTESAGYCLVSTAKREGMRVISIVMGAPTIRAREEASAALLNYGFRFYETRLVHAANQPVVTVPVWKGVAEQVALAPVSNIYVTIPRGQEDTLGNRVDVPDPVFAPLERDRAVGKLSITRGTEQLGTYPLHPLTDVAQAGFFGRIWDDVKLRME